VTTLVLIAKEPLPGKVKTRLNPPLTLEQAAELAAACIDDTLAVVASLPPGRRILFFEGARAPAAAADFELFEQPIGTLDVRLGALFDACCGPTVLIGMDTPQLSAQDLAPAFRPWPDDIDAWFGPAVDGGFWALGMREPRGDLVRGIPMSQADTGGNQLDRLEAAGMKVGLLATLTDVDTIEDALTVAAEAPDSRFARALRRSLTTPPPIRTGAG
jgi:glycosyltransferase A (GT-A) superfamily protein (DUF2064 family)